MSTEAGYLDFELTIQKAGENEYSVRAKSGEGEAEARFSSPFNEDKRALIDATLTKVALRSSAKVRSSSAPEVKKMKEVGSTLFEHAVSGEVLEFYHKCQGQADQQGRGIRWRLALDPSVGDLPWEFLFFQDEFLALNPSSPIVRYIKGGKRVAPLKTEYPLRVLVIIASPSDETPLDTTAEKDRITSALQPLVARGVVDVTFIEGPDTWERLIAALLPNRTHILHFIGHGAFDEKHREGVLVMEDADGQAIRIDSERLRVLVQGKSRLRLVVLNSCLGTRGDEAQPFSSMAAGLVRSGVPAVIAMQFEISDTAAREIAETFYRSLALNMPVDAAITEARRKIFLSDRDSLEWATPILYMQVPDGRLFQFDLDTNGVEMADGGPPTLRGSIPAIASLVYAGTHQKIPLTGELIKIGRAEENDMVLAEPSVSRKHAILTRTGSTYTIENVLRSSGTWVNGYQVEKQELKHNDVLRLGSVEFVFNSELAATPASRITANVPAAKSARSAKTVVEKKSKGESLANKAAKRYQDGEEAMANGDWAGAVKAFRGALILVPSYRDATHKLTVCEGLDRAIACYNQAQRLCEEKNYGQALQALTEARRLDPSLVDEAEIEMHAQCGQKYHWALGELQAGNTQRGAELLREVISSRSDFEDAAQRLDNLAEGGDGLLGLPAQGVPLMTVAPSAPTSAQPPQPAAASELECRLYEWANPDTSGMAEQIRQFFLTMDHETQIIREGGDWIVQGKKSGGWRDWVGMNQAATVMIETTGNRTKVSIGGGHWMNLLITGRVGKARQKQTIESVWRLTDNFVLTRGGRRVG